MQVNEPIAASWQGWRAKTFVDALNQFWDGRLARDDPPTLIESIQLLAAPSEGPMELRLRFRIGNQSGVWNLKWEDSAWRSLPDAVSWFGQVVWEAFPEVWYTRYRPEGFELTAE